MSKEIKAIECPKCGSAGKVEIRPDYFKCQSCDTEYYLDDDDITINHHINYQSASPSAPAASIKRTAFILGALFVFIVVFLVVLPRLLKNPSALNANDVSKGNTNYHWSDDDCIAYTGSNGRVVIAVMGQRDFTDDEQNKRSGNYIVFYDALTDKELKSQRLSKISKTNNNDIKFREFKNGNIYAIANKRSVFKINKADMRLEEVSQNFVHQPELVAGIAQIDFVGQEYGDGFTLMTNDGKSRFYFPIIDRVYNEKAYWKAQDAVGIKDGKANVNTYFSFSSKSDDFPDEKIKLIMYLQKDNMGGPKGRPFFQKRKFHNMDGTPRQTDFQQGQSLVLSYKDLTPGRLYFSANILYSDEKYVLISFDANAAEKANTSVQCLAVPTGSIVFTLPFAGNRYFKDGAVRYKDGFAVKTIESVLLVGMDGKLIKEFKKK